MTHTNSGDPCCAMLRFFEFEHLPEHLQIMSARFSALAHLVHEDTPAGPEKTMGMRKLLEAKDCMVRAML